MTWSWLRHKIKIATAATSTAVTSKMRLRLLMDLRRTPRMSYRRRETPGADLVDTLSKTESLAAVSSIRLVRHLNHVFETNGEKAEQ
jgi:hypothetical protein